MILFACRRFPSNISKRQFCSLTRNWHCISTSRHTALRSHANAFNVYTITYFASEDFLHPFHSCTRITSPILHNDLRSSPLWSSSSSSHTVRNNLFAEQQTSTKYTQNQTTTEKIIKLLLQLHRSNAVVQCFFLRFSARSRTISRFCNFLPHFFVVVVLHCSDTILLCRVDCWYGEWWTISETNSSLAEKNNDCKY